MKNPIYTTTLKPIENLKNKNGKYSEKNEFLVNLAKKCLEIKNIGNNFRVGLEFGKDGICTLRNGNKSTYHNASRILKISELSNFLTCLSVTMTDRCFILSWSDDHKLLITCLPIERLRSDIVITDKDSSTEKIIEVQNALSGEISQITETTAKGKRPLNDSDINTLKTAFNAMLGSGYNKEIVVLNKKNDKTA